MSERQHRALLLVMEFLGTAALILIGIGAVQSESFSVGFGHPGISAAWGFAVSLIVAVTHRWGGAHINPAVTIGLWTVGRFPARRILPYVIAQCAGAIFGSLMLFAIFGDAGKFGATVPTLPVSAAIAIEMAISAVLAFAVCALSSGKSASALVSALVLGAIVWIGAFVSGPLTGGSFNPARSLGPAVVGSIWQHHWIYWFAPIPGMILGMQMHHVLHRLFTRPHHASTPASPRK